MKGGTVTLRRQSRTRTHKALTVEQRSEAQKLRAERPPVIPGTNVIPDDGQRSVWYDKVFETMKALGLRGREIGEFCDIAGVPE
jgi:hypothetical protein